MAFTWKLRPHGMIFAENTVPMPPHFHLVLLIHAHQPCGNFGNVFEKAYDNCYLPFLEMLEKHPSVHMGLHYSGPLLSWIEENRPAYFDLLKKLAARGQVEVVGGGFYEPVLISIPPQDQHEQLTRLSTYIERQFGKRPTGAWLAERVWEPQLPSILASGGVDYTFVDDIHFLSAGFETSELFGVYLAEDRGLAVRLFPGLKDLRYLIPFGSVPDLVKYLRASSAAHPTGAAAMGDDMEKFGVWPGTAKHCFEDGWLEDFFAAIEENSSWLKAVTPTEFLSTHAPLGRADLPTASYTEMGEWALPTLVRQRYMAVQKEFKERPEVLSFLRGGCWRGFFRKYSEANLLHKKMLRTSSRIAGIPARRSDAPATAELAQARELLLRAQCNDAYWHGIFGGLYAPHLRTELWRNLIRAEVLADRHIPGALVSRVESKDFDADGAPELLFVAPEYQALLKPSDGATVVFLDFRPAAATLVNSITRRPEAYHARLSEAAQQPSTGAVTIHEQTRVKEPGLERFLRYDRSPRHAFRVLLFDPSRTQADYQNLTLQESASFASGAFTLRSSNAHDAELVHEDTLVFGPGGEGPAIGKLTLSKRFSFGPAPRGIEVGCELSFRLVEPAAQPLAIGVESIINLLAPSEPDRFFETPDGPQNLRFSGVLPGPMLKMEDGWQRVRVGLHAPFAEEFWIAPIETVSESEDGFERVYQGSQILALWRPDLTQHKSFSARLMWRIDSF
jgi:4-alpha-glucanotransferase